MEPLRILWSVADGLPVPALVGDEDRKVYATNGAFCALTGVWPGESVGGKLSHVLTPVLAPPIGFDVDEFDRLIEDALSGGPNPWGATPVSCRGLVTAGYLASVRFPQIAAERRAMLVVWSPIGLGVSDDTARTALDSVAEGVAVCSREGEIRHANNALGSLLGVRVDSLIGREFDSVLSSHVAEPPGPTPVADAVRSPSGHVSRTNAELAGAGTVVRHVVIRCVVGAPPESKIVVIVDDETEEYRRREDLRVAQQYEAVGLMAAGIAHDFNNVLTAVSGNIAMARELVRDGATDELLHDAEAATDRAQAIAAQLLRFSHLSVSPSEDAGLEEVVRQAVEFALRGSTVTPAFSFPSEEWQVAVGTSQLTQVVQNLTLNAAQAMADGGTVRIDVRNHAGVNERLPLREGEYVEISVQDDGYGIPETDLDRIFLPYFTTQPGRSGLGLSIASAIVQAHGGHIAVASDPGQGSTFACFLPAVSGATDPAEKIHLPHYDLHVLVMDDERIVRRVLGRMLDRLGCKVSACEDGAVAVDTYRRAMNEGRPVDVAILDLTIPGGIGGAEALSGILDEDPSACAIVATGYTEDPIVRNYDAHGFRAALRKPFSVYDVAEAIRLAQSECE